MLTIFIENWKVYGTRRIKDALKKANLTVSRRRLGRFMEELGIVFKYTNGRIETRKVMDHYIVYYNNYRYQWNLKRMASVQYRNHLLVA